jgi:hypothetical protein
MNEAAYIKLIEKLIALMTTKYSGMEYRVKTFSELEKIWRGHEMELLNKIYIIEHSIAA